MRRWTVEPPLHGYHWCDHCDESAYGPVCLTCRNPARWVPDHARRVTRTRGTVKTLEKISPAEWFQRMRDQINQLKTP